MRPPKNGFKPGKSGNPNGRPPIPQEVRVLRRITQSDVAEIGQMIIMGDIPSLKDVVSRAEHPDPEQRPTTLQVMIASGAIRCIKEGDVTTLNALLDRFVGKIPAALLVAGVSSIRQARTVEEIEAEAAQIMAEITGG